MNLKNMILLSSLISLVGCAELMMKPSEKKLMKKIEKANSALERASKLENTSITNKSEADNHYEVITDCYTSLSRAKGAKKFKAKNHLFKVKGKTVTVDEAKALCNKMARNYKSAEYSSCAKASLTLFAEKNGGSWQKTQLHYTTTRSVDLFREKKYKAKYSTVNCNNIPKKNRVSADAKKYLEKVKYKCMKGATIEIPRNWNVTQLSKTKFERTMEVYCYKNETAQWHKKAVF